MSVKPLNEHYSFTTPASIYDEESMTALELAGRQAAKINECVEAVNGIPGEVSEAVQKHIDSGDFDTQFKHYAGKLGVKLDGYTDGLNDKIEQTESDIKAEIKKVDNRVDGLFNIPEGSTTMDAEVIDIRTDYNGNVQASAGAAVRTQITEARRDHYQAVGAYGYIGWANELKFYNQVQHNGADCLRVDFMSNIGVYHKGAKTTVVWNETTCQNILTSVEILGDASARVYIPAYNQLVLNLKDSLLHMRQGANLLDGDITLIKTGYGYPVGGTLFDEYTIKQGYHYENSVDGVPSLFRHDTTIPGKIAYEKVTANCDTFMFFTDPHLCEGSNWEDEFLRYKQEMKAVFDASGCDFAICGGDWIGNSDTKEQACYKLGFIHRHMNEAFGGNYYHCMGNHDTNYQGVDSAGGSGYLPTDIMTKLWFEEYGSHNCYYTFKRGNTRFIVLDTQIDRPDEINTLYVQTQYKWFAKTLQQNMGDNIVVVAHIPYKEGVYESKVMRMTNKYVRGFIERSIVTGPLKVGTFDYTTATGRILSVLCGHTHEDEDYEWEGTHVFITADARSGGSFTADLCTINYDTCTMNLYRYGAGESRTLSFLPEGEA